MRKKNEEWRQIGATEYDVSNNGRVRSWKRLDKNGNPKILKPQRLNGRHLAVRIHGQFRYIHHLVMEAFEPVHHPDDNWVCHFNDDPSDNRWGNLYHGNAWTNAQDRKFNRPTPAIRDATAAQNQKINDDIVAMAHQSGQTPNEILDLLKSDHLILLSLRI